MVVSVRERPVVFRAEPEIPLGIPLLNRNPPGTAGYAFSWGEMPHWRGENPRSRPEIPPELRNGLLAGGNTAVGGGKPHALGPKPPRNCGMTFSRGGEIPSPL